MQKVLMLGWEYPPEISGGLGIATYGLLKGMASLGKEISFLIPTAKNINHEKGWKIIDASEVGIKTGEVIEEHYWEKITFIEIASRLMPYISREGYKDLQEKKISGKDTRIKILREKYQFEGGYSPSLHEEIARFAIVAGEIASTQTYDVVHGHDWMTFPACLAAGASAGKPVVLHVHSTEFERTFPDIDQTIFDLEKNAFDNADHVITVSHQTKSILTEHYEVKPEKISVVHNSVSPEFKRSQNKKSYPSKNPMVTFLGRMTSQKSPRLFIDVAKTLTSWDDRYRFTMAGEGYLLDDLKGKVDQLNMGDKFNFPGFLDHKKVKRLFSKTDVLLMPSASEPFGMVALEAALCGVPVVISDKTGALEVLKSAHHFRNWETYEMAACINNLINKPIEAIRYTDQLRKEARTVNWEQAAKQVDEVYKSLI